jgi:hypothetical protein
MAAGQYVRVQTQDTTLNRIQSNIENAFQLINGPFIGGNLLTAVAVGTSATVVNHKLGRQPQLWVICDQDTNTTVARTSWDKNTITLVAGSACTISIWVN